MIVDLFAGGGGASLGIDSYVLESTASGAPTTKTKQVALVGNSVSPPVAAAIVRANMLGERVKVA